MSASNLMDRPFREGSRYPSPITRVLALGYYDGPTNGILQCGDGGAVYKFDLIAGPFSTEDGLWDMRVFSLAPLPPTSLDKLAGAYQRHWSPNWPVWVPRWWFADAAEEEAMNRVTAQVLGQAGPPEWIIATFDLMDEVRSAKRVTAEEMSLVTDWLAFLGVPTEAAFKE